MSPLSLCTAMFASEHLRLLTADFRYCFLHAFCSMVLSIFSHCFCLSNCYRPALDPQPLCSDLLRRFWKLAFTFAFAFTLVAFSSEFGIAGGGRSYGGQ